MKKLILIISMFVNLVSYSQIIQTDAVAIVQDKVISEDIKFREDQFEIKESIIIWTDFQSSKTIIYFIENISVDKNGVYYIYCNTNGKRILFIVSFLRNIVYIDNNLVFFKLNKNEP
jgi:hypothetical protein